MITPERHNELMLLLKKQLQYHLTEGGEEIFKEVWEQCNGDEEVQLITGASKELSAMLDEVIREQPAAPLPPVSPPPQSPIPQVIARISSGKLTDVLAWEVWSKELRPAVLEMLPKAIEKGGPEIEFFKPLIERVLEINDEAQWDRLTTHVKARLSALLASIVKFEVN